MNFLFGSHWRGSARMQLPLFARCTHSSSLWPSLPSVVGLSLTIGTTPKLSHGQGYLQSWEIRTFIHWYPRPISLIFQEHFEERFPQIPKNIRVLHGFRIISLLYIESLRILRPRCGVDCNHFSFPATLMKVHSPSPQSSLFFGLAHHMRHSECATNLYSST